MKRIFFLLILFVISYCVSAQAPSKKCPTCGQSIAKCQYKGKHQKKTQPKPIQQKPVHTKPSKPSGTINGHDYVDLGLSVKWATCNVGASAPEEYGGYYAWGEISTKAKYNKENCFDCLDTQNTDDYSAWHIYKKGGEIYINPNSGHDAARENWGASWRLPSDIENEELCKKCKWRWIIINGHYGSLVTGPNGNSIFLPAAGYFDPWDPGEPNHVGCYWSSKVDDYPPRCASTLIILDDYQGTNYFKNRWNGMSIRPVTE